MESVRERGREGGKREGGGRSVEEREWKGERGREWEDDRGAGCFKADDSWTGGLEHSRSWSQ